MATSLAAWAQDWVARIQARAGFRRAAAAFPLTRPVARHQARALFDLCAGFVYSQVLLATVRLGLPERLLHGPRSAAALALDLEMTEPAMERLLLAAASLRLLARRGQDAAGRPLYGLGSLGAALIDNPGVTAMIEHHALVYADLRDPVALLRGTVPETALGHYWPYAAKTRVDARTAESYSALMAVSQRLVSQEVLAAYPMRRHRHLLDVGGGSGAFVQAAAAEAPALRVTLFDLPAVAAVARARLDTTAIAARCTVVGGDFTRESLPAGADLVSLVRVLHDHEDSTAEDLLRSIRAALAPGGRLLIAEPMAGTRGAEPVGDAYFGFYFLAMGGGRARTPVRIQQMLRQAGFSRSRVLRNRMPMITRIIVAE
ncbi:methyltransferase [Acidisoma sp. 7E03]